MIEAAARLRRAARQPEASRVRNGTAALEEVLILAILLPIVVAALWVTKDMCVYVYRIISTHVGWPNL